MACTLKPFKMNALGQLYITLWQPIVQVTVR